MKSRLRLNTPTDYVPHPRIEDRVDPYFLERAMSMLRVQRSFRLFLCCAFLTGGLISVGALSGCSGETTTVAEGNPAERRRSKFEALNNQTKPVEPGKGRKAKQRVLQPGDEI